VTSGGLGTKGLVAAAAIGAKNAARQKDVWVIAGDGGFQMTLAESSTLVQEKAAINALSSTTAFSAWCASGKRPFYEKKTTRPRRSLARLVNTGEAHGNRRGDYHAGKQVTPIVTKARNPAALLINFQVEKEEECIQ